MSSIGARMIRASMLEAELYEEVEAEPAANSQALAVVVLSALGMGIGSLSNSGPMGIFWHTLASVGLWVVWAWVAYIIGTRLLPTSQTFADHGELLRTVGFSSAPGVLRVLMLVDAIALPVFVVTGIWMLIAMVVAVRQALDYTSTLRAIAVCAIGFPVYALGLFIQVIWLGGWPA